MNFSPSDMVYNKTGYYQPDATGLPNNPFLQNGLAKKVLNKKNGDEVLYFINQYNWTSDLKDKGLDPNEVYKEIERLIRYAVPPDMDNMEAIKDWIKERL